MVAIQFKVLKYNTNKFDCTGDVFQIMVYSKVIEMTK